MGVILTTIYGCIFLQLAPSKRGLYFIKNSVFAVSMFRSLIKVKVVQKNVRQDINVTPSQQTIKGKELNSKEQMFLVVQNLIMNERDTTRSIVVIWVKHFQTEKRKKQ